MEDVVVRCTTNGENNINQEIIRKKLLGKWH